MLAATYHLTVLGVLAWLITAITDASLALHGHTLLISYTGDYVADHTKTALSDIGWTGFLILLGLVLTVVAAWMPRHVPRSHSPTI